jgi:hypothetical protein
MMSKNSTARDRAESRFSVSQKRSLAVTTDQQAREELVRQKTARLRSLRLAHEAAEKEKKEKSEAGKA